MPSRTVAVASRSGLHARPASLFTQAAADSGLEVTIAHAGGEPVDAASILFVMSLGVPHGDEVTLAAEGDDADRVLDELVTLLATDLDEEH
ncbi:phosphotransferase system HPr (HPr) family protein [Sanguibacter keddieii DSM 10542]|jgi:phosphocarrier protein|uniref:Phosphocarrier protein HPr n=1 Tax=Sanguibacter keddieii (strain ATCC 51767 / DSM 10542 / NCFB 3025 / ST-74) TaxID=446469 RepID=D1BBI9_SANKS|nr:HPr family phosphocarrier protein [Sanguibacter keddieii]ACZ22760.1 phosphotransferase system HPr (HPr) family protein [Sanguibacter keddieii DSM 10542]